MPEEQKSGPGIDIHKLLLETSERKKKEKKTARAELLQSMGVKEYFDDGDITINMQTCKGVECELCIEACPTNALYWKAGEVGIVEELCVFCAACVLSCIVDDCIQVRRTRPGGKTEQISSPRDVLTLLRCINSRKAAERVKALFPTPEAYLERIGT
jgi:NAD-dependent dihydropyrimidine dehydrogenase PreA subunit